MEGGRGGRGGREGEQPDLATGTAETGSRVPLVTLAILQREDRHCGQSRSSALFYSTPFSLIPSEQSHLHLDHGKVYRRARPLPEAPSSGGTCISSDAGTSPGGQTPPYPCCVPSAGRAGGQQAVNLLCRNSALARPSLGCSRLAHRAFWLISTSCMFRRLQQSSKANTS